MATETKTSEAQKAEDDGATYKARMAAYVDLREQGAGVESKLADFYTAEGSVTVPGKIYGTTTYKGREQLVAYFTSTPGSKPVRRSAPVYLGNRRCRLDFTVLALGIKEIALQATAQFAAGPHGSSACPLIEHLEVTCT